MSEEVVDAEVVGTELEPAPPTTLWRTDDPAEVLQRAQSTAEALMPVVREKGLVVNIQGREHLRVEAWVTLAAMLGVSPVCVWTKKLENGWEARVEARTLDGRVIGAAEAECLTKESRWAKADDYAVRSMAQTRATSKALASVLRFVATLGGASGTPAEEMSGVQNPGGAERLASEKQRNYAGSLIDKADFSEDQLKLIREFCANEQLKDGTVDGKNRVLEMVGYSDVPIDMTDFEPDDKTAPAEDDLPPF